MKKSSTKSLTRLAAAAAIVMATSVAPFLARAQAQSKHGNDTITLITGAGKVDLGTSRRSCSATADGERAIIVAVGGNCWAWTGASELPRSLYVKIASGEISFRKGGRSYIIRDAATIERARELFVPVENAMHRQSEVGRQMSDLRSTQVRTHGEEVAENSSAARIYVPDMSADFERIEAEAKRLSEEGGTRSDLSELQSELSELQSRVSDLQSESNEKRSHAAELRSQRGTQLSAQLNEMGAQLAMMGKQMSVMGRQGEETAAQAARQVKELLDQAVTSGIATPE